MDISRKFLPTTIQGLRRWVEYYDEMNRLKPPTAYIDTPFSASPFPGQDCIERKAQAAEAFAAWVQGRELT